MSQYREITSGLRSGPSKLSVANHLAVARGFKPKQSFIRLLGDGFGSNIREYDFGLNKENSVRQVRTLKNWSCLIYNFQYFADQ